MDDNFEVINRIIEVETIAVNHSIRDLEYLDSKYGNGRWLKLKGVATVKFEDGTIAVAKVHWYQAHGIGKRQMKIKEVLGYENLEDYLVVAQAGETGQKPARKQGRSCATCAERLAKNPRSLKTRARLHARKQGRSRATCALAYARASASASRD